MMDLSKNGINAAGAAATVALVLVGGLFVAKPQYSAAGEFADKRAAVVMNKTSQETKLASLKAKEGDLPELKRLLNDVAVQIPDHEDVGSIGRVVVEALNSGTTLKSFSHLPPLPHTLPEEPAVSLDEVEPPFEEPVKTAGSSGSKPEPSGPPVLQTVPLTIEVEGKSQEAIAEYLDALAGGERLILVQQVQVVSASSTEQLFMATIYAYAFTNSPAVAPATPAAETEE